MFLSLFWFSISLPLHQFLSICMHWSATTFKNTVILWCVGAAETAQSSQGMDSSRPLKVSCGIWHKDVSSRSFPDFLSADQRFCTIRSSSHHGSDFLFDRIEIWGIWWAICHLEHCYVPQIIPEQSFCGVAKHFILLKEATVVRKCCGMFQSNIHMNAST